MSNLVIGYKKVFLVPKNIRSSNYLMVDGGRSAANPKVSQLGLTPRHTLSDFLNH